MPTSPSLPDVLDRVRRRVLIHRRGLVALAAAVLAWTVVTALRPPAPPQDTVWAARRDLAAGTTLTRDDLARTDVPAGATPTSAHGLRALLGRTLAAPLAEGEIATATQVVGTSRLAGYPGRSAVPVRIPDADTVGLLRVGDRIDLVGSDPAGDRPATRIAEDAVVLALPRSAAGANASPTGGRLVVLAVPDAETVEMADAASSLFLTVIWNR